MIKSMWQSRSSSLSDQNKIHSGDSNSGLNICHKLQEWSAKKKNENPSSCCHRHVQSQLKFSGDSSGEQISCLKKGFEHFRKLKTERRVRKDIEFYKEKNSNNLPSKIVVSNSIDIPKSDENWIRIKVTYDDNLSYNQQKHDDSVSEVLTDYSSTNRKKTLFTENAVDVPDDFLKKQQRLSRTLQSSESKQNFSRDSIHEFSLEDRIYTQPTINYYNSSIIASRNRLKVNDFECAYQPNIHRDQIETMGVNCVKPVRKLRKHSVVPVDCKTVKQDDEQYLDKMKLKLSLSSSSSSQYKSESLDKKQQMTTIQVYPDIFESSVPSTIEWNNILHRRNSIQSGSLKMPTKINVMFENKEISSNVLGKRYSDSMIDRKIRNNYIHGSENNKKQNVQRKSQNFLRSFGGSVQNLMNFVMKSGNNQYQRQKSVSEYNLSNLSNSKLNKQTNKISSRSSGDLTYCPSVLYNRKQIVDSRANNRLSDKGINFKNFKKVFNVNLSKNKRLKEENPDTFQDLDGGFFEKFGSLLRQKSEFEENKITTPLAPLPEEETCATNTAVELCTIKETENDSGTSTLYEHEHDSDNDENEQGDSMAKHESFIEGIVGMNIDELYEEILFEILHNVGCEASEDVCQNALFEYVQDAFKIPNDRHDDILQSAQSKEPPEIRLNVEVIKAENLIPKDSNGFSDPFVTLFLESCSTHRYNTSVKSATLNPVWEEHFSLPIPENPNNEILIMEVWDFDAAETVGEKMNKIFEVKGIKGLRKLMKEIAITASTGKHDNELIGRTAIPLKSVPASGFKSWYSLEKGAKSRTRGSVLIRMSFSAEKNSKVAAQEHRHLLRILLMHELETSKVAPYWWNGKFSAQGEAVLTQHSAQSGLSKIDCFLAEWSVFSNVHQDHPLSFSLFNTILDKILPVIQTLPNQDEEIRLFWEGARKFLPSCFSTIRKLRKKTTGDKNSVKMLAEVLDILSKISQLEPPIGFDLLPKQIYGWSVRDHDGPNYDIQTTLRDAVYTGAAEWFEYIDEGCGSKSSATEEDKLRHLIQLIQLIRTDLQKAVEHYDRIFQQKMYFMYAQNLYSFYEKKLAECIQPVVDEVCQNIKRLNISEDHFEKLPEHEEINMGTTLFELYLVLKRFTTLGLALCPDEDNLSINMYYEWFTPGVTHWLDISVYKALIRIEKAIDLDKLIPVDETVKYSSSAVDTLAIFYQIKVFWQQLEWPDIIGAYTFVAKIVDDICRCCVFYADRMSKRVEELRMYENQQRFEVTKEWCLAINNIDYIRQSLSPFIKELGVDNIILRLGEFRSSLEAERCAATLKNVIANAIDTERNKILELIDVVARKMSPAMRRFLIEGAEILHEDSNSMERLMMYLEESLKTLHNELNEINFARMLDAIWSELSGILYQLVQSNLDKRRPPAFFSNLRDTLHVMVNSFKLQQSSESLSSDKETLECIEKLLELHAYETADLIHQYYVERLNDQKNMVEKPYGQLTVKGQFIGNVLQLEIMNARNLIPMDSNGTCDSFVKVHFMPSDKFLGIVSPKTSVQHKTLYPLYDEKFSISLSDEQRGLNDAIIIFSIKDKDLFGMSNQYIAECYLSFDDVENSNNEQIHLTLTRPEYKETDCLRALEYRQGDKQAKDFIKKLKQKAY